MTLHIKYLVHRHTNPEVINMDELRELPMGFGMALFQNREAAVYFDALPASERRRILQKVEGIQSKEEMQIFVDDLKRQ